MLLWQSGENSTSESFVDQVNEVLVPELFTSWEFWVVASVILLIGEVITTTFLLGAFLPGTLLAGLCAAFGWGFIAQIAAFSIGTLAGLLLLRPRLLKRLAEEGEPSNVAALVGQTGRVTEALAPGAIGRVKLASEEWRARAEQVLEVNQTVRVRSVEGNTLEVEALRAS